MADTVDAIVGAITNGIKWVRQKYRQFKVWLADKLVAALAKGWTAALTIAALIGVSIVVGYVWQIMMQNAIVMAVRGFITNIGGAIAKLAAFLQIDMVLSLLQLAVLLNEELYNKLSPLYDELGSLAQELELDFNYITAFLEVDRAILQATSSLTGASFLDGTTKYVTGLSAWLKKLGVRMSDYAADPQLIFSDIQKAIITERAEDANKALASIWAAIDFAGDWVKGKGQILITLVDDIDAARARMPAEIQEAIKPWYDDAIAKVRDFESKKWDPFWKQYTTFTDAVDDLFLLYGSDIAMLQRRINSPLDWLRTLLAMPEDEQATLKSTLDEFIGKLLPVEKKATEGYPSVLAAGLLAAEASQGLILAGALLKEGTGELPLTPGVDLPVVTTPWYEETT